MRNREKNMEKFLIRYATKEDAELIIYYIRELAAFEGELDEVTLTKEDLISNVFDSHGAKVIIGEYEEVPIGFALFHETFSTFLGKKGIGLVDLYIEPEMRNFGFGRKMLSFIANYTRLHHYGRLEWWVHDWNLKAKSFYERIGSNMVKDIRVYRLDGEVLDTIAKESDK